MLLRRVSNENLLDLPMPTLRITAPGTWTLLVDRGRPRSRSLGVPVGGAADWRSLALGNALLGNAAETPALEMALTGPTIVADADLAAVVVGAPFDTEARGLSLRPGRTFTLPAGVALSVRGTPRGARAYLCLAGGIAGPRILGSVSGLAPVRAGDTFIVETAVTASRHADLPLRIPAPDEVVALRVLRGSHAAEQSMPGDDLYTVAPQSNRMGLRLEGPRVSGTDRELTSEPVCPGTVQVPRDGQPIILGRDCQTIGGYPRLAQVIRADLDLLGQLRPGMRVRFRFVTLAEAEEWDRQDREELRRWVVLLRSQGSGVGR
jgi:antagonist of KipI